MPRYPHRLLVITAALSQIKSPHPHSAAKPNQIPQSLMAVLAGLQVYFLFTETHQLGEELLTSSLYQVTPLSLEANGYVSCLTDGDL